MAHMRFCIAPVSDQNARTPPMLSTVMPVPLLWTMFRRLLSRRLVACPGTRLKTPTPTSSADGIARNA